MRGVVSFILCVTAAGAFACGGTEREQSDESRAAVGAVDPPVANKRGSQLGEAGRTEASPARQTRSRRASTDQPSLEYLEGAWCFAREDGGGESGVVFFYADGTFRLGICGTPTDHYLDEPKDLEMFWENHPVVEVEPDRFVALLSRNYRVVYRRVPC